MASQATARAFDDAHEKQADYRPRHAVAEGPSGEEEPTLAPELDDHPDDHLDDSAAVPGRHLAPLLPDRDLAANRPGTESTLRVLPRLGRGDESVARKLTKLGGAWRILHTVPVGHNDTEVDHLLIGPGGVFTVTIVRASDASVWISGDSVTINGQYQPVVRNGRFEARRAGRLLSAATSREVTGHSLVAFVGTAKGALHVEEQPRDGAVVLLAVADLVGYLNGLPEELESAEIDAVYAAARHLSTWQPATVRWDEF